MGKSLFLETTMATAALPIEREGPAERLARAFAQAREELVRALAGLLGDPDDAQDVAQEAFLKCWRRRDNAGEVLASR